MIIKKTQNNEAIIKQLTELFNNAFEHSLVQTITHNNNLSTIKNSDNSPDTITAEAITLTRFIANWIRNTSCYSLDCYSRLMNHNERERFFEAFNERPYSGVAFKARRNNYYDGPFSQLFEKTIIPLTMRVKEHNGSIEESLLAVVKPFLVEEFVVALSSKPDTTLELLSVVNHYNDYDYQLERFINSLEENLVKQGIDKRPLELLGVWWLNKTFLKETIIPELKKRPLTDEQKQESAIDKNSSELVNNYYDYCLYYAFAEEYESVSAALINTLFFYKKEDFVKGVTLIKKALFSNDEVGEEDVFSTKRVLLEEAEETKPEWVDTLRRLLSSY